MRAGNRALHRRLGLLSYVLVPVIVVVTLRFVHYTVRESPELGDYGLFFLALVVLTLVTFVTLFALAMLYRKQPAVHARFMVSTLFPLFPPVTDRLIGRFMPSIIDLMPRIGGGEILQCAGFAIADTILVGSGDLGLAEERPPRVPGCARHRGRRPGGYPERPPLRDSGRPSVRGSWGCRCHEGLCMRERKWCVVTIAAADGLTA